MDWNNVEQEPKENGMYMFCYDGTNHSQAFRAEYKDGKWIIRDQKKPVFDGAIITPQVGDLWRQIIDVKEAN
jgi:hypothetical protein